MSDPQTRTGFIRRPTEWIILFVGIIPYVSLAAEEDHYKINPYPAAMFSPVAASHIQLKGYPGEKIDWCINQRIKMQDVEELIEPFREKTETRWWQSEFWGKWMLSAVSAFEYTGDPEVMASMKRAVSELLDTQLENGYIGNYAPESQLQQWDIWGRKYTLLGLVRYHAVSGDPTALTAAQRVADHLLTQVGPGKVNIVLTGNYRGMASCSVLEPIVYLYCLTREKRYLDFAEYIVNQWETDDGPQLVSKALQGVPVSERFPNPKSWWGWENGQKAYEMMSCYEGLLQLYLVTGEDSFLKAVVSTVEDIIDTEINVAGSGSAFECWYHGRDYQTRPTYHTMETCVTITWMKLCYSLLLVTGNAHYADQVEKSFYNALLASMKFDAGTIAKYSPLQGCRHAGEDQCGMHINCCIANGPRGFTLMPGFSYMQSGDTVLVNFYCESTAEIILESGVKVSIRQRTAYPEKDNIILEINPEKPAEFAIALRIPEWSEQSALKINGETVPEVLAGCFKSLSRMWKPGDRIELVLDLRGRLLKQDHYQAILRGPLVLARDSRFNDGFVDEAAVIQNGKGIVNLVPAENLPEHVWMGFTAPLVLGTDLEGEFAQPRQIVFCDFASAGNTWDESARYQVWIPETLNVISMPKSEF